MNKELLEKIEKLPVHNPRRYLLEKYFMATVQNASKHAFDDRVARVAHLVHCVKDLAALQVLIHHLVHDLDDCGKHLEVNGDLCLQTLNSQHTPLEVFVLNGEHSFFVYLKHFL